MYKQAEYLRETASMTRGSTYRIDLPEEGLLSGMLLKVGGACVSNATIDGGSWRLQDFLGKLEIIGNGATVIKSADFKHFQFCQWLRQGIVPPHYWRNYATNTQEEWLLLLFGRKLFDPDYGLDLSRWDNIEFRFTNSSSATYHSADLSISMLMCYLREHSGGFRGHLRTETWRDWTTVSDETKYFVLPTEFPISGIYLRSLPETSSGVAETGMANQMDDVDFSIGGGQKRLYKGGIDDIMGLNFIERGAEIITGGHFTVNADKGIDIGIGRPFGGAWAAGSKSGAGLTTVPTLEADPTLNTIKPESYDGNTIEFILRGLAFQNMVYLLHSQDLNPEELLDPKNVGETRLNIHTRSGAGYAGGTAQVVLERVATG